MTKTLNGLHRHSSGWAATALLAAAVTAVLLALPAGGAAADNPPLLSAKYLINLTFSMATQDGAPLGAPSPPGRVIPAGNYQLSVDDTEQIGYMAFVLQGPGVAVRTTNEEGSQDYMAYFITLQPNSTYQFYDGLNPKLAPLYFSTSGTSNSATGLGQTSTGTTTAGGGSVNSGSPVGSKAGTATKPASSTSSVLRGTLLANVSKAGKLSLTFKGKQVTSLLVGRYKVQITDQSPKNGFTFQETGLPATTVSNIAFVGKRTATLSLAVGQWLYYPSVLGKKTYFLVTRS